MKIMRKLRQSRELVGIDGEVKRPVHDVDVAPLGVKGNSCISGSLPSCFHVGQTDDKGEHIQGTGMFAPVVSPATEVETESPVWWNVIAADSFRVLGDNLLRVRTKKEIDVELSASCPINQARGRRQTHLQSIYLVNIQI